MKSIAKILALSSENEITFIIVGTSLLLFVIMLVIFKSMWEPGLLFPTLALTDCA